PACGRPRPLPADASNRRLLRSRRFSTFSLRQIRKTPLSGRFSHLAEREGFEPSIELLTLYSLSRGAPSASRASLRDPHATPSVAAAAQDSDLGAIGKVQPVPEPLLPSSAVSPGASSRLIRW